MLNAVGLCFYLLCVCLCLSFCLQHGVTSLQKSGSLLMSGSQSSVAMSLTEPMLNSSSILSGVSAPVSIRSTEVLVLRAATPGPGAYEQRKCLVFLVLSLTAAFASVLFGLVLQHQRLLVWSRMRLLLMALIMSSARVALVKVVGSGGR